MQPTEVHDKFLKVGSKLVPIVYEYELPGLPPSQLVPECPAEVSTDYPWNDGYGKGVLIGTAQVMNGDGYSAPAITQGITSMHNGYNMQVTDPIETQVIDATSDFRCNIHILNELDYIVTTLSFVAIGSYDFRYDINAIRHMWIDRIKYANYPYAMYILRMATKVNDTLVETTDNVIINPYYTYLHSGIYTWFEEINGPDVPPYDPSDPEPYEPSGDDSSDPVPIPSDPPIGVTNAGFINVYKPSAGALQGLGEVIFPDPLAGLSQDVLTALIKLCECFANQNLINYVIDCHVIPVTPVTGANANIKVGFRDTEISAPKVTSDYVNVSCGSISLAEFFGSALDYSSTTAKLFLPFVGFVDMRPEFWQAGTLSVDYKFNIIDGSFMAYVRSVSGRSKLNGSVIAQYSGNACMHFPLTGVNYSNMVSGLVGAASETSHSKSASPVLGAAYSAANVIAQGGEVQQSNGYNSTACILGVRTPYLLIERPVPSFSSKYKHDKGLPANIATELSNVTGFTVIEDIDLTGIPFTEGELTELRGLLKEGVYF